MVDLPKGPRRIATTQAPQGPSPQAVASPYLMLADALGGFGQMLESAALPAVQAAGVRSVGHFPASDGEAGGGSETAAPPEVRVAAQEAEPQTATPAGPSRFRRGRANYMFGQYGGPGRNQTSISTKSGKQLTVHAAAASSFKGFLDELEDMGYKIDSIGGLNVRNKRGGNTLSQHAYGNAIDINPAKNPFSNKFQTDLPPNVSDIAAKWGLSWGGDWKGKKDTMHFEWVGVKPDKNSKEWKALQYRRPEEPQLTAPAITRDDAGGLKVDMRPEFSAADKAWNAGVKSAALAEYHSRIFGPEGLMGLRQQYDGDAAGFRKVANGYVDKLVANAPDELAGPVREAATRAATQFENGILAQSFRQDLSRADRRIYKERKRLDDDMTRAAREGGLSSPEYAAMAEDHAALGALAAGNPGLSASPEQIASENAQSVTRHKTAALTGLAERAAKEDDDARANAIVQSIDAIPMSPGERAVMKPAISAAVERANAARAAEARAEQAADMQVRAEAARAGESLAMTGALTSDWLDANSPFLSTVQQRRLQFAANPLPAAADDPKTLGGLMQRAVAADDGVRPDALDARAQGLVTTDSLARIEGAMSAFQDDPRPWVSQVRSAIVDRLQPSDLQSPASGRRQLLAAFQLDAWLQRNPDATQDEAEDYAETLTKKTIAATTQDERATLPLPRFAAAARDKLDLDGLVATARRLKEARAAGQISEADFSSEVAGLRRWKDLLQRTSAGARQ